MINQRIGSFIAVLRRELNLSQEQFAERLGVSNRSVSRWENGRTLPDFSLMEQICEVTGVTLSELLSGARQNPSDKKRNSILLVLALWDREKLEKIKALNIWFALGLASLLAAVLSAIFVGQAEAWLLAGLGVYFHGLGFYRNNRDPGLTDGEKAILAATGDDVAMYSPEEMLIFARRSQRVTIAQYKKAFQEICENLAENERVTFAMVANEYAVGDAPGIWHTGVAVTQNRIFLCGETIAGRFMTRTVMNTVDRKDILSVRCAKRSIMIRTASSTLTIRGENLDVPGEAFRKAALVEV